MQAISAAIGKTGIQFFAQHYLMGHLLTLLQNLAPPDKTFSVPDFETYAAPEQNTYSNIQINLNSGSLSNYSPNFGSISQGATGAFTLVITAGRFQVNYQWKESYTLKHCTGLGKWWQCDPDKNLSNQWAFYPQVGSLTINVGFSLSYNTTKKQWEMTVASVTVDQPNVQTNVPSSSILLLKPNLCSSDHVTQTVTDAIQAIDFATPLNTLISGILSSIPGSGNLGDNIVYDFSLSAPDQLLFPNNDGIQIGVTGGASYNNQAFSGPTPPTLPLPLPPADSDTTHHLNVYVSNFEVDALNWAFYKAGKLNAVVNAADLPDPSVLKVKTYVNIVPALKPYESFAMQAQIVQHAAPVTSFQMVYELTVAVMAELKQQLPTSVYNLLSGLQGNNYVAQADLESDLNGAGIASSDYAVIEAAAKTMGMVVTHDIDFTLVIQNFQPTQPNIVFNVKRTDVLGALALGVGPNQTQTMQFQFKNASWTAQFISSNISKFDGSSLAMIWSTAGEPRYDQLLTTLGATGVPIPIMQGFQFDFTNAVLSIQESYVSILASVLYKNS